jgi:hypothetical protein
MNMQQRLKVAAAILVFPLQIYLPAAYGQQKLPVAVPAEIMTLVGKYDTLIAYKEIAAQSKNDATFAIVLRHRMKPNEAFAFNENPCDLIIGRTEGFRATVQAQSSKVVDCTYNTFAREIAKRPDDLNQFLSASNHEISYTNLKAKGADKYTFRYAASKAVWFLHLAEATYVHSNTKSGKVDVYKGEARYPDNIGFIPLSAFDPGKLLNAYARTRKLIH